MNFSTTEELVLEKKKKISNFFSHFFKNSRVLIILLSAAVITAISISVWFKNPDYQVLYANLSDEDSIAIINELNQLGVSYHFSENSNQLLVPKDKVYDLRLKLAKNNLPKSGGIGFELLDKERFGISQFNEQINYQRALEGELARTIQKIDIIKNARIHIAFPKSSVFLQDKKKPSASVFVNLQEGRFLNTNQINSILHLISNSIPDLSIHDISIVDQSGQLLNNLHLGYNQINDLKFKYSEAIESRYQNRIKKILEPLVGVGNVQSQVTAQIDFNTQEQTQEEYSPNQSNINQAVRSYQGSTRNQNQENILNKIPDAFSTDISAYTSKKYINSDKKLNFIDKRQNKTPFSSDVNSDKIINYELNHKVIHTKMNVGEIKKISAAVVVNFIENESGKRVSLTQNEIKNITGLIQEAIGYSQSRGDSLCVVNSLFFKNNVHKNNFPVQTAYFNHVNNSFFHILFIAIPWVFIISFVIFLLKKYIFSYFHNDSNKNHKHELVKNNSVSTEKYDLEKTLSEINSNDLNLDKLIHQIGNISNQNPRTIALIIRKWMSDKI